MHSIDLSDNKIIHWQVVFITNFITVTAKAELLVFFFFSPLFFCPEKVFHFPLFPAGNYIIDITGDCTVLVEANANRRSLGGMERSGESSSCWGESCSCRELNH